MNSILQGYILPAMMLLPLVGAGVPLALAALAPGRGRLARRAGILVALLEGGLVIPAIWSIPAGADLYLATDWVRTGLGMDLALEANGATLWAIGVCSLLTAAYLMRLGRRDETPAADTPCALLVLGAMAGILLAADLLVMLLMAEAAWVGVYLAMSARQREPVRQAARRFAALGLLGGVLIFLPAIGLACGHYARYGLLSFAVSDLLAGGPIPGVILAAILAGLAVRGLGPLIDGALRGPPLALPASAKLPAVVAILAPSLAVAGRILATVLTSAGPPDVPARGLGLDPAGLEAATWLTHPHVGAIFAAATVALSAAGLGLCLGYLARGGRPIRRLSDLTGLARTHPGTALAMAVCLLSLLGAPLTAGFFARVLAVGPAVWRGGQAPISLVAWGTLVLAGVLSIRPLGALLAGGPAGRPAEPLGGVRGQLWRVAITVVTTAILILGILPHLLAEPLWRALR